MTSCIKYVGGSKICPVCEGKFIKHGISCSGKQRFRCKQCRKPQVEHYSYNAYQTSLNQKIAALTKEGVGIRSTSRLLGISTNTVFSRIKAMASRIKEPVLIKGKEYEVDELRTFI